MKSPSTEKQIEFLHKKQVTKLIKKLGYKALTNLEIDRECKLKKIPFYIKTKMQDSLIPDLEHATYIMNTDTGDGQGIHWVAVVKNLSHFFIYDSFGRPTKDILPLFAQNVKQSGKKIIDTDNDSDQKGYTSVSCGHRCISALMIFKKYGLEAYLKL